MTNTNKTTLLLKDLKVNTELFSEVKEYLEANDLEIYFDLNDPNLMFDIYQDVSMIDKIDDEYGKFITSDNEVIHIY